MIENIVPCEMDPRKQAERGELLTFDMVQERLVEGMLLWRRAPDRERGWLTVRAYWPEIRRHTWFGDYADTEAEPRPLPLTRAEVAEMDRVGDWLRFVAEQDRRLVVLAIMALASGRKRIPWMALRRPMGIKLGADALRKRYSAAISAICAALNRPENGGKQHGEVSTPDNRTDEHISFPAPGVSGGI